MRFTTKQLKPKEEAPHVVTLREDWGDVNVYIDDEVFGWFSAEGSLILSARRLPMPIVDNRTGRVVAE